jgi:hypothetical protein
MRYAFRYDGLDQLFNAIRRRGFRLPGAVVTTSLITPDGRTPQRAAIGR